MTIALTTNIIRGFSTELNFCSQLNYTCTPSQRGFPADYTRYKDIAQFTRSHVQGNISDQNICNFRKILNKHPI